LNSIENSKANITIQETNEKIPEGEGAVKTSGGIIDDEGEDNVGEEKNKTWIIIDIVLILVVLIGAGIIKKKSK